MTRNNLFFLLGCLILIVAVMTIVPPKKRSIAIDEDVRADIAQLPQITFEGTVTGLVFDTRTECFNICPANDFPQDVGNILIDKIINVDNPSQMTIENISEDRAVAVSFWYSARPALVISEPIIATPMPDSTDPNTSVSSPIANNDPAAYADGKFTYRIPTKLPPRAEDNLPGLKIGDKIRTTMTYGYAGTNTIGSYEIIH